jgi:hypothetical protein
LVPDGCHDGDENVLLDGKRTRIEGDTEYLDGGDKACPETEEREGDELRDNARDGNGWEAEEEELVEAGDDDGPNEANEPSTEGVDGHVWVICVGYSRPDFRVRGIVLEGVDMVDVEVGVVKLGNRHDRR